MTFTVLSLVAVGQKIRASLANQWITAIEELQVASAGLDSITSGTGSPEGVVTAPVGDIYRRTDGGNNTSLYLKTSGTGNTGWLAVSASPFDTSWVTASSGTNPEVQYAYRRLGNVAELRTRLYYATAPTTLNITVTGGYPTAVSITEPGGSFSSQYIATNVFASVSLGQRFVLPGFYGTNSNNSILIRGGATNPSAYQYFEMNHTYIIDE